MNYDQNSPEAHKGALGEAIVKEILESWGVVVTRPDEYGKKSKDFSFDLLTFCCFEFIISRV